MHVHLSHMRQNERCVEHTATCGARREHTVVVLSDEAAKECRKGKAHFVVVGEALPGEEVVVWWWWPFCLVVCLCRDTTVPLV